ncbi:PglZ domain-containing protein [Orenia marismortui]|uniref:PglZ domain-containing protein n=1 Tax=Orenia marismortui TaxID=46469 RepID=A0A4R8HB03_9FIRM|nr:PglZ domain-containing protein [Orenia marismortui]TDX53235.1 PglZ domain-containing protein [Orenia marismortui]
MIDPLFYLIKDKYKSYSEKQANDNIIIVNNDYSYARSRVIIERIKSNYSLEKIKIIIQKEDYFNLYRDIEELGILSVVEDINPKNVFVADFHYQLPAHISAEFLIENNLLENTKEFNSFYNQNFDFESNLLLYKLRIDNFNSLSQTVDILKFILNNKSRLENLNNSYFIFDLFVDKIISKLDNFILETNIINAIKNKRIEEYFDFLLTGYIFSKYKKHHFKRFLSDREYNDYDLDFYYQLTNNSEHEEFYNCLYQQKTNLIKILSNYLKTQEGKMDVFTDSFEYIKYLDNVSGFLEYELDYLIKNLLRNINSEGLKDLHLSLISKAENTFKNLLEEDVFNSRFNLFKRLAHSLNKLNNNVFVKDNFKSWSDFYTQEYIVINNNLEENKNIFSIVEGLADHYKIELVAIKARVDKQIREINREYEDFLYHNYKTLLSSSEGHGAYEKLNMIREIINQNKPVIMIVIDAMRWDIWKIVSGIFEKYGYIITNENRQVNLSLVPSVTDISRRSLFAGVKYNKLVNKKLKKDYTYSINDEQKHLKNYFFNKKVAFASGGKKDFRTMIKEQSDIYSFIFTEADEMFHGFKDINKDIITALFENQIKNIAESISKYNYLDQAKIVVATDHGSVKISEQKVHNLNNSFKSYLDDKDIKTKSHGRYLKIYSDHFNPKVYREIKDYISKEDDYWYIINKEEMSDFYLPELDMDGHNYFWLISKYGYYPKGTRGEYTHGGFSMSETIIPFTVLERKKVDFINPELRLENSNLVSNQKSKLSLILINNNDYPLRNLKLKFKLFGVNEEIDYIPSNEVKKIDINLLPSTSGRIQENIEVGFNVVDNRRSFYKEVELNVEDSSKERINKSLKKSRELF